MDKSIELLGQDLARAGYAKSTQKKYIATATELLLAKVSTCG